MVSLPSIGLLGCGYLGQNLLACHQWDASSWYSVHHHKNGSALPYDTVSFSWEDQRSWVNLPQTADWVILTIPPVLPECEQEQLRLEAWCQWMSVHRPALKNLIYISTIGVYPDDAGVWTEQSQCDPATLRGQLRLDSENTLRRYFHCTAIRAGGIYGLNSNIVERCYANQTVLAGNKAVYRIHIEDLMGIIIAIIENPDASTVYNAVDNGAASQDEILNWLMLQPAFKTTMGDDFLKEAGHFKTKRLDADPSRGDRIVSNMALARTLGYQLRYPTYQLGLLPFV